MPIYAYKCASCGHEKDVLQKLSDAPLSVCPACGAPAFSKQLTAAGFQLKGSGWYVTDFRDGGKGEAKKESSADTATGDSKPADGAASAAPAPAAGASSAAASPAPSTAAPSPAPASSGGSGTPSA